MSKLQIVAAQTTETTKTLVQPRVKSFVAPWTRKGKQLLLACGKCQRKLKDDGDEAGLAKLRKAVKRRAKASQLGVEFNVLTIKCLKVCPKKGVAVCTQAQLGEGRGAIVRTVGELDLLLAECASDPVYVLHQAERRGEIA